LRSLEDANYEHDNVTLEVSVDLPRAEKTPEKKGKYEKDTKARLQVLEKARSFRWTHGKYEIIEQTQHQGLTGQWLNGWNPREDDGELLLVLEDDLEVSSIYYLWLKRAICKYYVDSNYTNFDPFSYGISLQSQDYVVGQSTKVAHKMKVAYAEAEKQFELEKAKDPKKFSGIHFRPTKESLLRIRSDITSPLFRYQLVGTWGLLLFPTHWRAFKSWYINHSQKPDTNPCVPFLESSSWWAARPHSVWSQWIIRWSFERGYTCIYPNVRTAEHQEYVGLVANHREIGENYRVVKGASHQLLSYQLIKNDLSTRFRTTQDSRVVSQMSDSEVFAAYFTFPSLQTIPTYDFHFSRVTVIPSTLAERPLLFTERHWRKACQSITF
jgi:hypothetical protein